MWQRLPRKWKFIIITLTCATIAGLVTYSLYPAYTGLVLLFFYIIPSNSFIPFPHEPAIIYYGKIFGPFATTLTAAVPTLIACVIDYAVLTPVFSRTRLCKLKDSTLYQKTVYYYSKMPFLTNMVTAVSPVPFYPVRILSVASGYPMWKYTTAVVLGRIPRYYFLALFGAVFNIPNWVIGFFFLSLVTAAVYQKIAKKRKRETFEMVCDETLENSLRTENKTVPTTIIE